MKESKFKENLHETNASLSSKGVQVFSSIWAMDLNYNTNGGIDVWAFTKIKRDSKGDLSQVDVDLNIWVAIRYEREMNPKRLLLHPTLQLQCRIPSLLPSIDRERESIRSHPLAIGYWVMLMALPTMPRIKFNHNFFLSYVKLNR